MLVQLKRDWFGPNAHLYKKGTVEYNGDPAKLPSDSIIMSEKGTLPVSSNTPKPGFGAAPLEEQILALIPGAAPTHQIDVSGDNTLPPVLTDEEKAEATKEADAERVKAAKAKADEVKADTAELRKETEEGLKKAEAAAEAVQPLIDPTKADPFAKKK